MVRPLRIIFEGAYYHVINRGRNKQMLFLDKNDYGMFMDIVKESCRIHGVSIVAYCIMGNHYHLVVHTPNANLSQFMRQVNSVYTQRFNKRYKQDGTIFKGRYKSIVVQEGSNMLRLIKYVHENPLRAGIVKNSEDYLYSSDKDYCKGMENEYLRYKKILESQWKSTKSLEEEYRNYMKLEQDKLNDYLDENSAKATETIIYGDKEYIDEIKAGYLNKKRVSYEIPEAKRIRDEINKKRIKDGVLFYYKISESELYKSSRGRENIPRQVAIRLIREVCGYSYVDIANEFGRVSYKAIAKDYDKIKQRCKNNEEIEKIFNLIKGTCSQVET